MPAGAVYVGRPTKWGNPFRVVWIKRHLLGFHWHPGYWMVQDHAHSWYPSSERVARRFSVWMFRRWMQQSTFAVRQFDIEKLRGKDLLCWCRLDQECHADVLLEIANETNVDNADQA